MSVLSDKKMSAQNCLKVHTEPTNDVTAKKESLESSSKSASKPAEAGGFKSLKYTNEIQTIFPMKQLKSTWEDDLQNKYKLVEDQNWDKGFKVWRSLPMQSELEQKLNVNGVPLKRSSDFTRTSKPEAYLPGFSARKAGPISRPRDFRLAPLKKAPVVKKEVKTKRDSTRASEDEFTTLRRESGGMLQDGIVKQTQKV